MACTWETAECWRNSDPSCPVLVRGTLEGQVWGKKEGLYSVLESVQPLTKV